MVKWRWVWVLVSDRFMGCSDRTASTCRWSVSQAVPRRVWGFRWGRHELDRPHARCSQRRESYTYLGRTGENVPSFARSFAAADSWGGFRRSTSATVSVTPMGVALLE